MTIKILHIFPPNLQSRFSGQNILWKSIFRHWDNPDVLHTVLDGKNSRITMANEAFQFEYPPVQKSVSTLKRALWVPVLFRNLTRYKNAYDILHVHVLWWGGLLIGPWAKRQNIPALYESVLLDADTPGAIIQEQLGETKLRCLKSFQAILAISEALANDYREHGFSESQVFTLNNCLDTQLFHPVGSPEEKLLLRRKYNIPESAMALIFVGSVIKRKGVDVLVEAFIRACASRPNLRLLIVGPKDRQENPSLDEGFVVGLHAMLEQHSLSEKVAFMGLIQDREQLAEIYRLADIFVFPSNQEGLGNVVIEAMATGLPVIVSRLPVLEKIVEDGENGLYVPVGDPESLKKEIIALSYNPSLRAKLGLAANAYAVQEHGFERWQSQMAAFYAGLLLKPEQT